MTKSKNILITGASTGVGYGLAEVFTKAGYEVYGSVRRQEDAARLREELGERFHPLLFDVTNYLAIDKAAEQLTEKIGHEGLAGLINNAGIAVGGPLVDLDIEEIRHQYDVNVFGLIKVTQAFLPLLGARENHPSEPGRILQISSVAGKLAMPFLSSYVGSKHAIEGFSHSLRRELQLYGIDVVIIGPGHIKTPIWNKSAGEDQEKRFQESVYSKSLMIFLKAFVVDAKKNGWPIEKASNEIFRIFEKRNPKTRYALVANRFKNWTLPRLLSDRRLDKLIKKGLKIGRES